MNETNYVTFFPLVFIQIKVCLLPFPSFLSNLQEVYFRKHKAPSGSLWGQCRLLHSSLQPTSQNCCIPKSEKSHLALMNKEPFINIFHLHFASVMFTAVFLLVWFWKCTLTTHKTFSVKVHITYKSVTAWQVIAPNGCQHAEMWGTHNLNSENTPLSFCHCPRVWPHIKVFTRRDSRQVLPKPTEEEPVHCSRLMSKITHKEGGARRCKWSQCDTGRLQYHHNKDEGTTYPERLPSQCHSLWPHEIHFYILSRSKLILVAREGIL